MKPIYAVLGLLLWGGWGLAQGASAAVGGAVREILEKLQLQLVCAVPEVRELEGSPDKVAQSLTEEVERRGWQVLSYRRLSLIYVLVLDPDPSDPSAYALGGWMQNERPDAFYTFLTRCYGGPSDEPIGPVARGFDRNFRISSSTPQRHTEAHAPRLRAQNHVLRHPSRIGQHPQRGRQPQPRPDVLGLVA
ncbi:MAG: hypothetical protein SFU83_18170 [Meiothermus sp.]|nr:hypothetical protein [Meiothermus sp.]